MNCDKPLRDGLLNPTCHLRHLAESKRSSQFTSATARLELAKQECYGSAPHTELPAEAAATRCHPGVSKVADEEAHSLRARSSGARATSGKQLRAVLPHPNVAGPTAERCGGVSRHRAGLGEEACVDDGDDKVSLSKRELRTILRSLQDLRAQHAADQACGPALSFSRATLST